jgi:RNA polymerase-binding transcription factor DksA
MTERHDDVLTPEVREELRERLEARRTQLRRALMLEEDLGGEQTSLGASADITGDSGDASVDLQQVDIEVGARDNQRLDLIEVEHALAKMAAGTYGYCEECGRPIPLARLRAYPAARYDAQHQAAIEAQQGPR